MIIDILIIISIIVVAILVIRRHSMIKTGTENVQDMNKEIASLKQQLEEAKQESRLKDVYLHNICHEIRNPLNAVVGFAQLMALPDDIVSTKEKEEYNEYIAQNSSLLMLIVDDILNISDIKSGNFRINKTPAPLNNIGTSAIASVKYRVTDKVKLSFTSDFDDSFMLKTDVRRVQQILINFLTNAIKHTEEGSIVLHCSRDENPGMVTFSVTDTGEGVPLDKADKIFERFTKLNDFVEGTGLGLNICRTLAEKLYGKVYLDKTYRGKGARFVFVHPID